MAGTSQQTSVRRPTRVICVDVLFCAALACRPSHDATTPPSGDPPIECVETQTCPCSLPATNGDGDDDYARVRRAWGGDDRDVALEQLRESLTRQPHDTRLAAMAVAMGIDFGIEMDSALEALGPRSAAGRVGLALSALHGFHLDPTADRRATLEARVRSAIAVAADDPYALAVVVSAKLAADAGGSSPTGASELEQALVLCAERGAETHAVLATACARVHYTAGEPSRAQALLDRATKLDPEYAPAWLVWGQAELEAGDLTDARERLTSATRTPSRVMRYEAHLALGILAKRNRDTSEAEHQWRLARGLCVDPLPPELAYNLGTLLAASPSPRRRRESVPLLERFLESSESTRDPVRLHRARQALRRAERPKTPSRPGDRE